MESLKKRWLEQADRLGYLGLTLLIVFGLMNVIHNLTYRQPSDGASLTMENGALVVVDSDFSADTSLQIGDVLIGIDDRDILTEDDYQDFLHEVTVGSRHLYQVMRGGTRYEYWVEIKGLKNPELLVYTAYTLSGFIYILFLFLVLSQNLSLYIHSRLIMFCLCVYLAFVFQDTPKLSPLDWISYHLSQLGTLLLPSALFSMALKQTLRDNRWLAFLQVVHWVPTLAGAFLTLILPPLLLSFNEEGMGPRVFSDILRMQGFWGGALVFLAVLLPTLLAEIRRSERNLSLFWAVSWLPYGLTLWKLEYPFSSAISGLAPIFLPLAMVFRWSREGRLYLGSLGKKGFVYLVVTLFLILGYFLFVGSFQVLLGSSIGPDGLSIVSGLGIMFAAVSYTALRHYVTDALDRLIYGERFEPLKELLDFSAINRADMEIEAFLTTICARIRHAFGVNQALAYVRGWDGNSFWLVGDADQPRLVFETLPPALLQGGLLRGAQVTAGPSAEDEEPLFAGDDVLAPIRVSGQLAALIVFVPREGRGLPPEEDRMLKSLLEQCGVLMENMELYENINQKAQSIMQLKEYNENIIESSRIGILTTDEMERAVSCNSAFADIVGAPRDALAGQKFPEWFMEYEETDRSAMKFGMNYEVAVVNRRGREMALDIRKTPLKTKDNVVYGTLYLVEDISEKKRISQQMMQQEKLASIGMLAAGVAHEINTPLTGIVSYAQFLIQDPAVGEEQRELLDLMLNQSERATHIVASLLNFSRKESQPKGPVDVIAVLEQTLKFLHHQLQKNGVNVVCLFPEEAAYLEGLSNQIQQVFVNLIVNAKDAMPEGGELKIEIRMRDAFIDLRFIDAGTGMDWQTQKHIFDPFFTTKEVGKGTGLGLSVVYNIVQEHGGHIEVESKVGRGSIFSLRFPRLRQPVPA
nr:ATP-binding protein [Acanthopleuribacter pedis]